MTIPAVAARPATSLAAALHTDPRLDAPDGVPAALWHRSLLGPAEEFLQRPGKALRAQIVELGARLGGGAPDATIAALAETIELLHAGSLIVDDVEDGSLERRGAPALHQLVGAPVAINTGNWMYFWALVRLDDAGLDDRGHAAAVRAALRGLHACHQGQALDLGVSISGLAAGEVGAVVAATTRLKTGALTAMAARLGAIGAGAPPPIEGAIAALGEGIGVGLQMLDDLGSLCAPTRAAKAAEDLGTGRPTWPWAWYGEIADPLSWARMIHRARAAASGDDRELANLADVLRREVEPIGRRAIRDHLDGVLAAARAALGDRPALAAVRAHLTTMEASYG
jgi:geranylgeranyl pyrophosphate synthase